MRDWLTHLPYVVKQAWPAHGRAFYGSAPMTTESRLIVLHSTETTGFPGYNGGAANPHFTIDLRTGEVRQHVPLSWGSRCLAVSADNGNIRDVTVNVTGTIQIETIGAVTPGYPDRYGHYDLPRAFPTDAKAQGFLARLLRDIHLETGIPLEVSSYATWVAYPNSYGAYAAQRLSSREFRDARGVVGHQHAVANDHGDGLYGREVNGVAVDLEKVLAAARGGAVAAPESPAYSDVPSPANNFLFPKAQVVLFQTTVNRLIEMGLIEAEPLELDGSLGPKTTTLVRKVQADWLGFPPEEQDGLPGPRTTKATGELMATLAELPGLIAAAVAQAPIMIRAKAAAVLEVAPGPRPLEWVLEGVFRNAADGKRYAKAGAKLAGDADAKADALLEALQAVVESQGSGESLTPAQVQELFDERLRERLANVDAKVTVTLADTAEPVTEEDA